MLSAMSAARVGDTLGVLAAAGLSLWFPMWAWRRKGELDRPLTKPMTQLRIAVASGGLLLASIPVHLQAVRVLQAVCAFLGISFWVWPNLAYHAIVLLRRRDLRHVTRMLRAWNPLGFEGDPDEGSPQLMVYDEYAPRVLTSLDQADAIGAVQAELSAIRSKWSIAPDVLGDRKVAAELVGWRRKGAQNVAAA